MCRIALLLGLSWTAGRVLTAADAPTPAESIPTDFDGVASTGHVWALVGSNGELRELWRGPGDRIDTHGGEPPRVLRLYAFAEIREEDSWRDLRALGWLDDGSRPGRLRFRSANGGSTLSVTGLRGGERAPIVFRYGFSSPRALRFRLALAEGSTATLSAAGGAAVVLADGPESRFTIVADPAGSASTSGRSAAIDVPAAGEIAIAFHPCFVNVVDARAVSPEPASGVQEATGARIRTGIAELDDLLEASVAAVEANSFSSGVVIAGTDGWYKNAWIRDGTYSVLGADLAGRRNLASRFFRFWMREGGFSWGGENEAQQPAIGILGIRTHALLLGPGEAEGFLREAYTYVKRYADYYSGRVEKEGMIGTAEEWICQVPAPCAWPNAEVYAGLAAAVKIARVLGAAPGVPASGAPVPGASFAADASRWDAMAARLKEKILADAYDAKSRRFIPLAGPAGAIHKDEKNGALSGPVRDERVDSGMLMLARSEIFGRGLGAVAADDPRFAATQAWIHRALFQADRSISRFDANLASPHYAGGEWPVWPISACWAAQVEHLRGRIDRAWDHILSGIVGKIGADHAASLRQLPEQWRHDGRPVRTTRLLTWSHGELLTASLFLLLGLDLEPEGADLGLAPSLPPGSAAASVQGWPFRGWTLDLEVGGKPSARAVLSGHRGKDSPEKLRVATPRGVVELADSAKIELPLRDPSSVLPPSRCANGPERARLAWEILLGEPVPVTDAAPAVLSATGAADSTRAWEDLIRRAEDRFDAEKLRAERVRHQAELLKALGPRAASSAGPLPPDGLRVATLFTAQEMRGALAGEEGRENAVEWCRRNKVDHAFVESFRDGYLAEDSTLAAVRDRFARAGIVASGCITPTGLGKASTGWKTLSCYTATETRARLREIFAGAARLFDEVMIDDFLCTDCQCGECQRAKGGEAWPEYRMRLLREVTASDILGAARAARPGVRVIIKYPQWYDDFHNRGYDVAGETALYPAIWIGTETRDPDSVKWGRKAQYEAYFIMRWLGGIGGMKTGGGWFDPYGTSPVTYVEQARQTVLGGAREMLLFCHASLVEPQHAACPEALVPELDGLRDLASRVRGRTLIGVAAPKLPSSQPAKGEEFLFDYVGMLGIPLVPCTAIPDGAPAALITSHAARDGATGAWLRAASNRPVILTRGAEPALSASAFGGGERPVRRLEWGKDARELMDLPREALDELRAPLLEPLGLHFSAPGRVALYLFGSRGGDERLVELAAVESFNDVPVEVLFTAKGRVALEDGAIVLPPTRLSEVRHERRGDADACTIPPRTLVVFWLVSRNGP